MSIKHPAAFALAGALVFLLTAPAHSQYDLPIREHIFENGLKLLVLERPGDHRVACKIFTDMGALNETVGNLGAAHFLEHLMFKGTETLGTTSWARESRIQAEIDRYDAARTAVLNRERNALSQRGVFHDYQHRPSIPEADSLQERILAAEKQASTFRRNGAMMKWYQRFGGSRLTATTEQEYMKFDINLPVEKVELFLRVEADRMRNTVFRDFDAERMILVEQRYGDLNRPLTRFYEAMDALVQTVHPVFWPEGHLTDFENYNRQYLREMYETFFVPNNTTLVFVGGVRLDQLVPMVKKWFGSMPRADEPPRVTAIEPVPQAEKRMIWRAPDLEPAVEIRHMVPGIGHPDRPHVDVLDETLTDFLQEHMRRAGVTSRIDVNTRVVHTARFGVPASINIHATASGNEKLAEVERELLSGIQAYRARGPDKQLVDLAKRRLRFAWHQLASNADRLAFEIGHFEVMDHWRTLVRHLRARDASTSKQLQDLAGKYLVRTNRSTGVIRKEVP